MNIVRYFFILFFPIHAFATVDSDYLDSFVDYFQERKFDESLHLLDAWEKSQPSQSNRVAGMKAAVYLAMGDLELSKVFMDEFTYMMNIQDISDPSLSAALHMYKEILQSNLTENSISDEFPTRLCKHKQPKGVKLKYWFGVGQILIGVLAAPFSAGTSSTLILSGTAMVVDAASDAINNRENWERELDERQRINPEIQKNSFSNYFRYSVPALI